MISISTVTKNANGSIIISEGPKSKLKESSARVSRTATLDGGCVITHSGHSHGDRTFKIVGTISESDAAILQNIFETETFVNISTSEGFFAGVIEKLKTDNGNLKLTFLVKEKLA